MNQKATGFFISVLFGVMFLLAGCGGGSGGSGGGPLNGTESGSAAEYDLAEALLSDVDDMVDDEASDETGLQKGTISSKPARVGCGTATFNASARSITLDFGTGCRGRHDRQRQGKIEVAFSGPYKEEGSTATITFSNYRSDGHQAEGTKTITNLGRNDAGLLVYQVITESTITTANGAIIEWLSEQEREWTEGEETADRGDDVYTILSGVSHWTNSNFPGETFGSEIIEPVVIELTCKFKLRGKVHVLRNGKIIVKIQYKATCEPQTVEDDEDDNDEDDGDDDDNETPENHPPTILPLPTQAGTEGEAVSLPVSASDPDGDTLTYTAEGLPPGLTIDPATGLISGTLSCESTGNHLVIVTVTDGTASATDAVLGIVTEACDPPVLTNPGDQTNAEGDNVSLQIEASDPEGDPLTFSATGLPPGLAISSAGLITGTLTFETSGLYSATVTITDGANTSDTTFAWTVTNTNRAPVATNPGNQTHTAGEAVSLQIVATDPDGDPLTFSATGLPPNLVIDPTTGLITGTIAPHEFSAEYPVTVTVSDGALEAITEFLWTVTVN
jgi:hypothetical protein